MKKTTGVAGGLLVLAGLILLGYFLWAHAGTNFMAERRQDDLVQQLERQWEQPRNGEEPNGEVSGAEPVGSESADGAEDDLLAFGLVRIARFGLSYEVPLVRGVDDGALASGIGWDANSSLPGKEGETIIAAHRVTNGEPFRNFPSLQAGDEVVVETQDYIYRYRLLNSGTDWTVRTSGTWEDRPLPASLPPAQASHTILLITCTDLYSSDRRSLARGVLVASEAK